MNTISKIKKALRDMSLKVCLKSREKLNPYFAPYRRKKLKRTDFTIISNNCWAGHVYRYYGLSYTTPTVGLFFFADDYLKFIKNLKHYINSDLHFIPLSESRHEKELRIQGGKSLACPIGVLDDIEIIFLHYKTEQEANTKWSRRKKRINWDNLYVKMSQMNGCSYEMMCEFDNLPYNNKFIFVRQKYGLKSEVVYESYENDNEITNDTNYFRKYINITNWLNGKPYRMY